MERKGVITDMGYGGEKRGGERKGVITDMGYALAGKLAHGR
jgi:hypothetical protein